jgi:hypothetical protein
LCGDVPAWVDELVDRIEAEREVVGQRRDNGGRSVQFLDANANEGHEYDVTAPATDAARQWQGWGTALKPAWEPIVLARTALKPAWEPIVLARKPLVGTVAANVLAHGTGALNVEGCRVGDEGGTTRSGQAPYAESGWRTGHDVVPLNAGRYPANVLHDGSEDIADVLGNAQRFFYCAKASRSERGAGNSHPTVKPVALMRYLVRLVTPPGGIVLDPFMGSGTTGVAAVLEGRQFIGIESGAEYVEIAKQRIEQAKPTEVNP